MLDPSRWILLAFGAACTALIGCVQLSSPWDRSPGLQVTAPLDDAHTAGRRPPSGHGTAAGRTIAGWPLSQDASSFKLSSVSHAVSDAFQSATHKVSSALEIKPKVTPADDATKLSSVPKHLDPVLFVKAAAFSESQGNLAAAQHQYEKALELRPDDVPSLIAYARFRQRLGDSEQAIQTYRRAQSLEPDSALIANDLGLCHVQRGELDQAAEAFRQAVAHKPASPRYRNNLAGVLVQLDQPEEAIRELTAVYPEAVARYNVGFFLYRLNQPALAAAYVSHAIRLDPSLQPARMLLARLGAQPTPEAGSPQPLSPPSSLAAFTQGPDQQASPQTTDGTRRLPSVSPPADALLRRTPAP